MPDYRYSYEWTREDTPLQAVLDNLPLEVQRKPMQGDSGWQVSGTGTVSAEAVAAALREAGFASQESRILILGPPTQHAEVQSKEVQLEVLAPSTLRTGLVLPITVKATNLSYGPAMLDFGDWTFLPVLEDEAGRPVRWWNSVYWHMPGHGIVMPPGGEGIQNLSLPLNQFNPRLPLPPGRYQLKVVVQDLGLMVGMNQLYGREPHASINTTITGPWLNVTP